MPVDKTIKVGDRANKGPITPIILTNDWTMEWGLKVPVTARNLNNHSVVALKDGLHGFYVYKISCKCGNVQRSGLESLIKVGRSAAPVKPPTNAKEDGTITRGGIRERLLSYPQSYSMNDTELLMVILFSHRTHAMAFESTIKGDLKRIPNAKAAGEEWFDSKYEKEVIEIINEHRAEQREKYTETPRSTPAPEQRDAAPGGSGGSGGSGVVAGRITRATPPPPAQPNRAAATGRVYPSKPPPPRTASLELKKKYAKNAAMKIRNQAERDGKPEAYQKEVYKTVMDKWTAYYGI